MRCLVNQVFYLISLLFLVGGEIRAPPNINPQQQYQQVPVQQQVHVPVQQMPVQQMPVQQMPVQQMPVQQMPMQQGTSQQQIPVQQGAHVHGQMDPKLLNTANINQEKAHIQEHMAVPLDTSKMTEQELQFHYFKMHDADNNNKLDGCELIKSLIHWHEEGQEQTQAVPEETLEQLADKVLGMADFNDDLTLPRILGMYSILKALTLIHCTVFIHYKPIISMGICSLLLTIIMYFMESLYYHSTTLNFYIIFPCVLNGLTLIGLIILSRRLFNAPTIVEDENAELLRQATAFRRRKAPKKGS